MEIAVTTPTGHVGREVVAMLVRAGLRPRVLVRDPDRLDRVYQATVAATRAGSRLDQNRSNRDEGLPAEDRAAYRLAEIQRLLSGAK